MFLTRRQSATSCRCSQPTPRVPACLSRISLLPSQFLLGRQSGASPPFPISHSPWGLTWVKGSCSELAPHLQTLCSMTRMANRRWAMQAEESHESPSSGEICEWTRWRSSSKHSAASPRQPRGKRLPAKGPLAKARRRGSGQRAGSELVCSCWKSSYKEDCQKERKIM